MPRATIARPGQIDGVGVHSGAGSVVSVRPAHPGNGVVFRVNGTDIPAHIDSVYSTTRRTGLAANGRTVDTVEHFLAATYGADVHDLIVEVDGPELPIGDGSARHFTALFEQIGRVRTAGVVGRVSVAEPFELSVDRAWYQYTPSATFTLDVEVEWKHPLIGRQRFQFGPESSFAEELASARTFVLAREVETLRAQGLLKGGTVGCGIVLTESGIAHGELRWPDEFVRHKTLDLLGDLTLLGVRVLGDIRATRPSHGGNVRFAQKLRERMKENPA